MHGSADALPPFSCPASSGFGKKSNSFQNTLKFPIMLRFVTYYFLVPIGALLLTYIHIYLWVSAYNNHWCRLCKMLVYLNIQNLLPEKQKEWIMNLRLDCKIHNSELWRHMFSISNYSCLMLKSMYLLDLEDELAFDYFGTLLYCWLKIQCNR